ncbi:MAG: Rrf2 family transcriptional regulator [Candidatus Auribacterota bacterium]
MLKLSTRYRYGLRILVSLADNGDCYSSIKHLCDSQELTVKYIESIIAILNKKGMVISKRGAQGGYKLSKPADAITLKEVQETLNEPVFFLECIEKPEACTDRSNSCPSRLLWLAVKTRIDEILESLTIKELCEASRLADIETIIASRIQSP